MYNNNNHTQPTSLTDLIRRGFFKAIYAKSHSNPESRSNSPRVGVVSAASPVGVVEAASPGQRCGAGDAPTPPPPKCRCLPPANKCSAGDRGKAGAGVTGSRTGAPERGPSDLPAGADNPGLLRFIHNAARYRIPQCFEGACVSVKQNSNENWVFGHSLSFSSVSPGGYKLLLSYMDKDKPTKLPYFVMEAAPGGQMSCEVRVGPTASTRATVVAQIADAEFYSFESIFDAYFHNFTASVIAVNRDFIALHYLQVIQFCPHTVVPI